MPNISGNIRRPRLILHDPRPGGHHDMVEELVGLPENRRGNHDWKSFANFKSALNFAKKYKLKIHPCNMIACRNSQNIR